ncbi:MAG: YcgN family cysteine cluster protein [Pseudomonadota bacterium]
MQRTTRPQIADGSQASAADAPFWQRKQLHEMTQGEWESLCDGCGRCCLLKVEDEDTGDIYLTNLACRLLDLKSCRCRDYANRQVRVPDCISLDPDAARTLSWLPPTCAYRRISEGQDLSWWHPLVSGTHETVQQAGISVTSWCLPETAAKPDSLADYIVEDWDVLDEGDDVGDRYEA